MKIICFCFISFFSFSNVSTANGFTTTVRSDSLKKTFFQILQIQSYEDNLAGYIFDNDDKPFVDFTFSARTRIYPFDYLMKILPTCFSKFTCQ